MPKLDEFNLEDYAGQCVQAQEIFCATYRVIAQLCAAGMEHGLGAVNEAASLFGHKADWVKRLAEIFCTWGLEDIRPEVPLNLYETAIKLPNPRAALTLALENEWSARQLQDHYDAEAGRHTSRVTVFKDTADLSITAAGILVTPHECTPIQNFPTVGEVTIKEILND